MKDIKTELNELVENQKILSNKGCMCKYSLNGLRNKAKIGSNFRNWFYGNKDNVGIIERYGLESGKDYVEVSVKDKESVRMIKEVRCTVEVYAFLCIKYGLITDLTALDILQQHLTAYQTESNLNALIVTTGRADVEKILKKFNLI